MAKTFDVIALGELLIDMTPYGVSEQGNAILEVNPGGAPCNVLAMAAKLGSKTAFIGKVGHDQFGNLLKGTLEELDINTDGLVQDERYCTTMAFVHLDDTGDRTFSFYRKPGADMMLEVGDVREDLIKESKIFHFGTLSMTDEPSLSASKHAIELAKKNGCLLSFDPNIRPPLWDSMDNAKAQMAYGLGQCHILKISDDEIQLATGCKDLEEAAQVLLEEYPNIKLLFLT
ncbi:MAG: carbohydrate kinase, partial [Clostridiales bacterium]|nr:carbohydrate kinase [Clostridiales bacterium]